MIQYYKTGSNKLLSLHAKYSLSQLWI